MDKIDFKKTERPFYTGKQHRWDHITLPPMQFLIVDGMGPPFGPEYAAALGALYPMAYGIKFAQKALGYDFVVPPLEGLWWSDKRDAFTENRRDEWRWRMMIRMPDRVTQDDVDRARKPDPTAGVAFITFDEGPCLQTLHIGPYANEAPVLADLHDHLMPELQVTFRGHHHEIYLSDPRRAAPEKLRTILRQPVGPV